VEKFTVTKNAESKTYTRLPTKLPDFSFSGTFENRHELHRNCKMLQYFIAVTMSVGRGGKALLDFEIISKKGCFFNFER